MRDVHSLEPNVYAGDIQRSLRVNCNSLSQISETHSSNDGDGDDVESNGKKFELHKATETFALLEREMTRALTKIVVPTTIVYGCESLNTETITKICQLPAPGCSESFADCKSFGCKRCCGTHVVRV